MLVEVNQESHICNCTLGGIIPHQTWTRPTRTSRRDINHRPPTSLFNKTREDNLPSQEDTLHIDIEHTLEFVVGHFDCGLGITISNNPLIPHQCRTHLVPVCSPRIINQNIQSSKFGKGKVDNPLPVVRLCHIHALEDQVCGVKRGDFLASFSVDIGDDYFCALFAEATGNCGAESGASPWNGSACKYWGDTAQSEGKVFLPVTMATLPWSLEPWVDILMGLFESCGWGGAWRSWSEFKCFDGSAEMRGFGSIYRREFRGFPAFQNWPTPDTAVMLGKL